MNNVVEVPMENRLNIITDMSKNACAAVMVHSIRITELIHLPHK